MIAIDAFPRFLRLEELEERRVQTAVDVLAGLRNAVDVESIEESLTLTELESHGKPRSDDPPWKRAIPVTVVRQSLSETAGA